MFPRSFVVFVLAFCASFELVASAPSSSPSPSVVQRSTASLTSCLAGISGLNVVTSSSSAYAADTAAFNRRLTFKPAAVIYPTTQAQISKAVVCAASASIPVSARSGGHSYAAYGLGGEDGHLIVDLSGLKSITMDTSNGHVVSGTGNTLGSLATSIYNSDKRALPHGTCPYVGTGGHTSFGGFGPYSRQAGLLLDTVVAADVVLANGTFVTAAQSKYPDLFWALRGAAPSFGIVTAWHYATLPAPSQTINWQLNFQTFSSSSSPSLASEFLALQSWVSSGTIPNALGLTVVLGADNGKVTLQYQGTFYGPTADMNTALAKLRTYMPTGGRGTYSSSTQTNWLEGLEAADGSLDTSKPDSHDTFFAKSLMTKGALSSSQWTSFANYLLTTGASSSTAWFAEIDLYGGAIDSVSSTATAYANRGTQFTFQLYASSSNYEPPYPSNGISFINDMLNSITTSPQAAYPNYVDPTLSTSQWQSLYFGANYARLSALRKIYDPNQVFKFPQSIV